MSNELKQFPVKLETDFKNELIIHCRRNGTTLAALIRELLKEYAEREGILNNE